jgi:predicted naringenin-chalcone synthase
VTTAYINRIVTGVPEHDIHGLFVGFARTLLEPRARAVFDRMAVKAQIARRFSVLPASGSPGAPSVAEFYPAGRFPSTGQRMERFETCAPALAADTVAKLDLGTAARSISHVIVTTCTGMVAPGIDLELIDRCGLDPSVERTVIGFMGCYAAINGLKLARHVVRSSPESRVLVVNLELCTLHLQEAHDLERVLSFLVFGDGCAASVVSGRASGIAMDRFHASVLPETRELITWKVRDLGFDMFLSGRIPGAIARGLEGAAPAVLDGAAPGDIDLWAVHPGGRSILDAVEHGLALSPRALATSRSVLERFGNMSSATVMFVLEAMFDSARAGQRGCAMSFGPGLTAETMLFHKV